MAAMASTRPAFILLLLVMSGMAANDNNHHCYDYAKYVHSLISY
jgi:hypothetical protein